MLIDLVISEERDPWDIDIAEIANNFLARVREMAALNLRLSGKTLLAASILLRMKSETLMEEEEDEVWDGFIEDDIFQVADAMDGGETKRELPTLTVPPRRRDERKTTLFELIEALQRALSEEMIRKNFPRETRRRKMVIKVEEEGIKERIAKVYERIKELARLNEVVRFSELIQGKSRSGIVEVMLPVLYLASNGRIVIWQKELFGEIFITLGC
jgi:segregation and condensation protein A